MSAKVTLNAAKDLHMAARALPLVLIAVMLTSAAQCAKQKATGDKANTSKASEPATPSQTTNASQTSNKSKTQDALNMSKTSTASKTPTTSKTSDASQTGRIAQLEREARAIAKTTGCSSADQCRAAPVGERPCGGPRDYIVYCARTTNVAALNRKLAELRQVEIELNKKSGAVSTCEYRMPPQVGVSGGSCRAR
jgi:hypothetical protein